MVLPKGIERMDWAFNCCFSLKEICLPESIKDISWALQYTDIKSVEFPEGTEDIAGVMSGTESIEAVFIPKTVKNTYEAFIECENLRKVILEDGMEKIEEYTFYHCINLKEIVIPKSIITIEDRGVGIMEIREYENEKKLSYKKKGEQSVPGFVIKGERDSAAEEYANKNGIRFIEIE